MNRERESTVGAIKSFHSMGMVAPGAAAGMDIPSDLPPSSSPVDQIPPSPGERGDAKKKSVRKMARKSRAKNRKKTKKRKKNKK